jgi:hypothetical protein
LSSFQRSAVSYQLKQRQGSAGGIPALFDLSCIGYSSFMPAKDRYHDTVARALTKEGWNVTDEQVKLMLANRRLYVDIRAVKANEILSILVEVKGFENAPSQVEYLADAVGKYVLYSSILNDLNSDERLYLAVPELAYNGILSEKLGQSVIKKAEIRLIVFDPEREEIVQWID